MPMLRSEGTLIQQKDKIYWFKNDFTGVEVSPPQVLTLMESVIGRELGTFERNLLTPRPFDGSTRITIVSMLANDAFRSGLAHMFVVIGYVYSRRENSTKLNYNDVSGIDSFIDTEGTAIGRVRVSRREEPGLETPFLDPIDFIGGAIADIARLGARLAIEAAADMLERRAALMMERWGAEEAAKVIGAEVAGAMSGPKVASESKFWKFWRAGVTTPKEFTATEVKEWTKVIKKRMLDLGVPEEHIGIRGLPGESGEAFSARLGDRGANCRGRGISVHGNVFDDWAGFPEWNAAKVTDRIEAIIAHEWMEFNELSHFEVVELATGPLQELPITREAHELLVAMSKKGLGWPNLMDKRMIPAMH
jgi:hypothetical protein